MSRRPFYRLQFGLRTAAAIIAILGFVLACAHVIIRQREEDARFAQIFGSKYVHIQRMFQDGSGGRIKYGDLRITVADHLTAISENQKLFANHFCNKTYDYLRIQADSSWCMKPLSGMHLNSKVIELRLWDTSETANSNVNVDLSCFYLSCDQLKIYIPSNPSEVLINCKNQAISKSILIDVCGGDCKTKIRLFNITTPTVEIVYFPSEENEESKCDLQIERHDVKARLFEVNYESSMRKELFRAK